MFVSVWVHFQNKWAFLNFNFPQLFQLNLLILNVLHWKPTQIILLLFQIFFWLSGKKTLQGLNDSFFVGLPLNTSLNYISTTFSLVSWKEKPNNNLRLHLGAAIS